VNSWGNREVHAVMLAHGKDRAGVLRATLGELESHLYDPDMPDRGFSITQAWVRSFGAVGVVMLRFKTHEAKYRRLLRQCAFLATPGLEGLTMSLRRADRPWVLDTPIETRVYTIEMPYALWRLKDTQGLSTEDRFEQVVNHLSADAQVDVAQLDFFVTQKNRAHAELTQDMAVVAMRLFDLGRRGRGFLNNRVLVAHRAAGLRPPNTGGQIVENACDGSNYELVGGTGGESSSHYLTVANREPVMPTEGKHARQSNDEGCQQEAIGESSESLQTGGYGYVGVHGMDCPGLLAEVARFVSTFQSESSSARHPLPLEHASASRRILRSCCRGLGREGVVLVSTRLNDEVEAAHMERGLHECLRRFYRSKAVLTASRQPIGLPISGFWTAKVHFSPDQPPTLNRTSSSLAYDSVEVGPIRSRDRSLVVRYVSRVVDELNRCARLLVTDQELASDPISIYFLDLRIERSQPHDQFDLAMGLWLPLTFYNCDFFDDVKSIANRCVDALQSNTPLRNVEWPPWIDQRASDAMADVPLAPNDDRA
jgi:hypothetical protein